MQQILQIREVVITFYKRYESAVLFAIKLIVGLILLNFINGIGGYDERLASLFSGAMAIPFYLLMSILFAILPPTLGCLLISLNIVIQVSQSPITALLAGLIFSMVLLFYARMDPKKSYLIIAMIIGFYLKVPYAVVIFSGLYFGLSSIIPVSIGTFLWSMFPLFEHLFKTVNLPETTDLTAVPTTFISVYQLFFTALTSDFEWVFFCFVFAMVVICVHFVSRLSINYSREISIALGGAIAVFGMCMASLIIEINVSIIGAFGFSLLSVILVEMIAFFDLALEYNKAERVQFEDDEYYYYVRAIPKILTNNETIKPEGSGTPLDKAAPDYDADRCTVYHPRPSRPAAPPPPVDIKRAAPIGTVKKTMTVEEYARYREKKAQSSAPPPVYKKNDSE